MKRILCRQSPGYFFSISGNLEMQRMISGSRKMRPASQMYSWIRSTFPLDYSETPRSKLECISFWRVRICLTIYSRISILSVLSLRMSTILLKMALLILSFFYLFRIYAKTPPLSQLARVGYRILVVNFQQQLLQALKLIILAREMWKRTQQQVLVASASPMPCSSLQQSRAVCLSMLMGPRTELTYWRYAKLPAARVVVKQKEYLRPVRKKLKALFIDYIWELLQLQQKRFRYGGGMIIGTNNLYESLVDQLVLMIKRSFSTGAFIQYQEASSFLNELTVVYLHFGLLWTLFSLLNLSTRSLKGQLIIFKDFSTQTRAQDQTSIKIIQSKHSSSLQANLSWRAINKMGVNGELKKLLQYFFQNNGFQAVRPFRYHKLPQYTMFNVPDGLYRLEPVHVKILGELLAETFVHDNKFWQAAQVTMEELKPYFQDVVRGHIQAQDEIKAKQGREVNLNMVVIRGGQVTGCYLAHTIEKYASMLAQWSKKEHKLKQFRQFESSRRQLFEGVDISSYPVNTTGHIHFVAKNKANTATKQQKFELAVKYFSILRESGFKRMISRATNEKLVSYMKNLGFRVLNEVKFESKGQVFPQFLVEIDLENPMLLKLISKQKKQKTQPRL